VVLIVNPRRLFRHRELSLFQRSKMGFFSSTKSSHSTGDMSLDSTIARFKYLEQLTNNVSSCSMQFFRVTSTLNQISNSLGHSFASYYAGSDRAKEISDYADLQTSGLDSSAVEKVGTEVNHILHLQQVKIQATKKEIATLISKDKKFQHYSKKLRKLENVNQKDYAKGKAATDSKGHIRLSRNRGKLDASTHERDAQRSHVMVLMAKLEKEKIQVMNPIFQTIVKFQEEYFQRKAALFHSTTSVSALSIKNERKIEYKDRSDDLTTLIS